MTQSEIRQLFDYTNADWKLHTLQGYEMIVFTLNGCLVTAYSKNLSAEVTRSIVQGYFKEKMHYIQQSTMEFLGTVLKKHFK